MNSLPSLNNLALEMRVEGCEMVKRRRKSYKLFGDDFKNVLTYFVDNDKRVVLCKNVTSAWHN